MNQKENRLSLTKHFPLTEYFNNVDFVNGQKKIVDIVNEIISLGGGIINGKNGIPTIEIIDAPNNVSIKNMGKIEELHKKLLSIDPTRKVMEILD